MNAFSGRRPALAGLALLVALTSGAAFAQQQQRPAATPQRPAAPAPQAQPAAPRTLPDKGADIVIVDPVLIERDGLAFQALRNQEKTQRTALQSEAAKLEAELRNADQELARQRTVLSPEAFRQKQRDLEKRFNDAQQSVQGRRRDLDETFGNAYNQITTAWLEIVRQVAEENEYKVVLARTAVVVSATAIDISSEVVQRLNKKLPTMNVAVPPVKK